MSKGSKSHQISAPALALYHIGNRLFIQIILGQDTNDQNSLFDQRNSSVL